MKYRRIISAFNRTLWAIVPEKLMEITEFLTFAAGGGQLSAEEIASRIAPSRERRVAEAKGNVTVIPLVGIVSQRGGPLEDVSEPFGLATDRVSRQFQIAMADPDVKAVILDVDSPGGSVHGVEELSREIFNARGGKPIVAVANSLAASAAYWIATAADELVVTPGGEVGSVGIWAAHIDERGMLEQEGLKPTLVHAGKHKVDFHPWMEMTEASRERLQNDVNHVYSMFVQAVARHRAVEETAVRSGFGEGALVPASQAVKMGMADRVGTLAETIERFGVSAKPKSSSARRAEAGSQIQLRRRELRYQEIVQP